MNRKMTLVPIDASLPIVGTVVTVTTNRVTANGVLDVTMRRYAPVFDPVHIAEVVSQQIEDAILIKGEC